MTFIRNAWATTALVLATSSLAATTRKSLSFSPPHPSAHFTTNPPFAPTLVGTNTHNVARAFLQIHMSEHVDGYYIRKDSYTDTKSGVTHVYIRQVVDGLEVADGNINMNIRDGKVLSYGNSFFKVSGAISPTPTWHQQTYCASSASKFDTFTCGTSLARLRRAGSEFSSFTHESDPRPAAYFFMLAANSLPSNFDLDTVRAELQQCASLSLDGRSCEEWLVSGISGALGPIKARKVYVQTPTKDSLATNLNLAWRLEVTMPDNSYEAYVSAHDPSKIISVVDWVSDAPAPSGDGFLSALERTVFGEALVDASEVVKQVFIDSPEVVSSAPGGGSYRVWKWGVNDPASGDRSLQVSPYDKAASPLGWHAVPAGLDPVQEHSGLDSTTIVNFTTTIGNNVIAQSNWAGGDPWKSNPRPEGGKDLVFDFPYGTNIDPKQHVNASVTQLFYQSNMYHDLLYAYGFDEPSGNFQQYNFGKGGLEGDGVIINAQDGKGYNNANFLTPPDGQNGRCRMYIWNTARPFRDGGLDAGILIHELSHGLSTRLTGGPSDVSCVKNGESGGLGEGWGDYIATSVRSMSTNQDYPMGAWASNQNNGIRYKVYSTNTKVNPTLYGYLQRDDYRETHDIGEVWAQILWVVADKLVEKHGFAKSLFPSSDPNFYRTHIREGGAMSLVPKHGNTLMLQLLVNGLKLQPCRPTFLDARDAIIAADKLLTGGENKCLLWSAFASRGLGSDAEKLSTATYPSINGFKVPSDCE